MASGSIGSLLIEMGVDLARLRKDVAEAKRTVSSTMADVKSSAMKLAGVLGVSLSAAAFVGFIKGAADAQDKMSDLAQAAGESVETFSALAYAMKHTEQIGAETLQGALKKLSKQIAEASAGGKEAQGVFTALGIGYRDSAGGVRKASEVLLELARVFAATKDDPVKTAYALKLMGKSGDEMIPALNKGREELQRLMQQAKDTGHVVGEEAAEQAEKFNLQLTALLSSSALLGRSLANELLPWLNESIRQMGEARKEGGLLNMALTALGGTVDFLLGGWVHWEPIAKTRAEITALTEDVRKLDAQSRAQSSSVNPGVTARWNDEIVAKRARIELLRHDLADLEEKAKQDREKKDTAQTNKPSLDPSGLKNQTEALALQKRFESTLQSLNKKYFDLTHAGEVANIMYEMQVGVLARLTPAQKAELEAAARKIDVWNRAIAVQKEYVESWEHEVAAIEVGRAAVQDLADARRAEIDDLKFSVALVGQSAREAEKMNAERAVELDMRKRIAALPKDDSAATSEATAEIMRQAEEHKKAVREIIASRQSAERDWVTGAKSAFDEYVDVAGNAAEAARQLFTDAFGGMEDALVKFTTTGKFDFKSMAYSIAADIARIQIRTGITAPLAELSKGWFADLGSSLFGGARAGGGDVSPGQAYLVGERGPELFVPDVGGSVMANRDLGNTVSVPSAGHRGDVTVVNNISVTGSGGVTFADVARAVAAGSRATLRAAAELRRR